MWWSYLFSNCFLGTILLLDHWSLVCFRFLSLFNLLHNFLLSLRGYSLVLLLGHWLLGRLGYIWLLGHLCFSLFNLSFLFFLWWLLLDLCLGFLLLHRLQGLFNELLINLANSLRICLLLLLFNLLSLHFELLLGELLCLFCYFSLVHLLDRFLFLHHLRLQRNLLLNIFFAHLHSIALVGSVVSGWHDCRAYYRLELFSWLNLRFL